MTGPTDLATLFTDAPPGPGYDLRFRSGVVVSWNPLTAENTVRVGGTEVHDLPILNTSEALLLEPGAVVSILAARNDKGSTTYAILGRMTIPGTPSAATALNALALRMTSNYVDAFESRGATGFGDLATPGPEVTDVLVGATGAAIVIVDAYVQTNVTTTEQRGGWMGYQVAGATSLLPANNDALILIEQESTGAPTVAIAASHVSIRKGLNPGLHTFTAKYEAQGAVAQTGWGQRTIAVIPL